MLRHSLPSPSTALSLSSTRFLNATATTRCSHSQLVPFLLARHFSGEKDTRNKEKLVLFDTTLRDGEQCPGGTLDLKEKLQIAHTLSNLGVDVCEAGFPIASQGDFEAVTAIAKEVGMSTSNRLSNEPMAICGLSRALPKDIERCYTAISHAPKHRIHTFLATSDIHLKYKLHITRKECLEQAVQAVAFAKNLCEDIEFSTEDGGRSDANFLVDVITAVIEAGAKTINIPDTVGYTTPEEYGNLFAYLIKNVRNSDQAIFSTHCHNDLGLATANTLSAVANGARQSEVTINGIGERAGNTALEEIVMTLKTRPQYYPVYTDINTEHITRISRMVSRYTGIRVQPNKAIIGDNAFAHEAGIHQDGVLKHQATYEIMLPESIGLKTNRMVLGKHSGKHAYKKRLEQLGYMNLTNAQVNVLVDKFKLLADKKRIVTDADMEVIVEETLNKREYMWLLNQIHVTSGNFVKPTATVTLINTMRKKEVNFAAIGNGPVNAIFHAIRQAVNVEFELEEYNVKSITGGTVSLGDVSVTIREKTVKKDSDQMEDDLIPTTNPQTGVSTRRKYIGRGANTDILVASGMAYVDAINRLLQAKQGDSIPIETMQGKQEEAEVQRQ